MYQERSYRRCVRPEHLSAFQVVVKETDLWVYARENLGDLTRELVLECRGYLEGYIENFPAFMESFEPLRVSGPAPAIVREMAAAGRKAGVGPMAAVAGAVAEYVGKALLRHSEEVIVENGGDVFLCTRQPAVVGIMAGDSPLSLRIGLKIPSNGKPTAICTSSGTVGHSKSFGLADAVSVVSASCPLADAAATSIGNRIQQASDIEKGIDFGKRIKGVNGIVIVQQDRLGLWGDLEVVPLEGKNG